MNTEAAKLRAGIRKARRLPANDRPDDSTLLKMVAEDYEDFARLRSALDRCEKRLARALHSATGAPVPVGIDAVIERIELQLAQGRTSGLIEQRRQLQEIATQLTIFAGALLAMTDKETKR
ncbi:MAG TPA: hypothetical protein VM008_01960 [Phycisphaerae bacterium]|nr:hypothetical protein [Phycisphaerae bacterium]